MLKRKKKQVYQLTNRQLKWLTSERFAEQTHKSDLETVSRKYRIFFFGQNVSTIAAITAANGVVAVLLKKLLWFDQRAKKKKNKIFGGTMETSTTLVFWGKEQRKDWTS